MGLNCEKETAYACRQSGAERVDIIHTLRFLNGEVRLGDYQFLIFIGGFLDGDYLGSARVGVNRFKYVNQPQIDLKRALSDFTAAGRLILGICNGFQLLVKLGLLPDETTAFERQAVSLTRNQSGIFENRWVHLSINPDNSNIFTRGCTQLYLPVRHGEGRIVIVDPTVGQELVSDHLIAMTYANISGHPTDRYPDNPNGSWGNIAAISNRRGNILGMMPHPEAFSHYTNHPHWTRLHRTTEDGEGVKIFKNAYRYLDELSI
jgi:phosphoribosylformylglycinamidine synthase subunit PurQ / glutaminase